jgi:hypothetical protein
VPRCSILFAFFIYTEESGRRPQAVVYIKRGMRPQAAGFRACDIP